MTFAQIVGRNIRRERLRGGLTQRTVGLRAGIDGACICHYEKGQKVPRLESFVRIAHALGVSPLDLLPGLEWDPQDG